MRRDAQSLDGEILRRAVGDWENPIEWGGICPAVDVDVREINVPADATVADWEEEIKTGAEGRKIVYSDGSKAEGVEGMVEGGWYESEEARGGMAVGGKATVWDVEIAGMELALKAMGGNPVLILSDSRVAIMAVKKAGKVGMGRTKGLTSVVSMIKDCEEEHGAGAVSLAWVKAHVSIPGNERADLEAKEAVEREGGLAVTEGGIRACVKQERKGERVVKGFGMGRVIGWSSRLSVTAYSQLRTGKGRLAAWRHKIGKDDTGPCRRCNVPETGAHAAVGCIDGESFGRKWSTWRQMDEKHR